MLKNEQIYPSAEVHASHSHTIHVTIDVCKKFCLRYIVQNLKCLEEYKKYDSDVPEFLRNRPSLLLNHIMPRWTAASRSPSTSVKELSPGVFEASLADGGGLYSVTFHGDMPNCTCQDWARTHMPCKHILAIFVHLPSKYSWATLPEVYRNCPHFCVDEDFIQHHIGMPSTDSASPQEDAEAQTDVKKSDESNNKKSSETRSVPGCTGTSSGAQTALQLRDILKEIGRISYLVTDDSALFELKEKAMDLMGVAREMAPKQSGLQVLPQLKKRKARMQVTGKPKVPHVFVRKTLIHKRRLHHRKLARVSGNEILISSHVGMI